MGAERVFDGGMPEIGTDLASADPWVVIVQAARAAGIRILKPKENCKKCHGLGYVGRRAGTGEPVPCPCIFPKEEYDREIGNIAAAPANRAARRARK